MNNKILHLVIPARSDSFRLRNKMLISINNEKVINCTINGIKSSEFSGQISVFTDSLEIKDTINSKNNDINVIITNKNYINGVERISDNIELFHCSHFFVIHADQPFINKDNINTMVNYFKNNKLDDNEILMGYSEIDEDEASLPSVAKVVLDNNNNLLYISRSKIPSNNHKLNIKYKKGCSLVIIPKNKLLLYYKTETSELQLSEDNEWIKFFDTLDCKIKCIKLDNVERDINDIDDLNYLRNKYKFN